MRGGKGDTLFFPTEVSFVFHVRLVSEKDIQLNFDLELIFDFQSVFLKNEFKS